MSRHTSPGTVIRNAASFPTGESIVFGEEDKQLKTAIDVIITVSFDADVSRLALGLSETLGTCYRSCRGFDIFSIFDFVLDTAPQQKQTCLLLLRLIRIFGYTLDTPSWHNQTKVCFCTLLSVSLQVRFDAAVSRLGK